MVIGLLDYCVHQVDSKHMQFMLRILSHLKAAMCRKENVAQEIRTGSCSDEIAMPLSWFGQIIKVFVLIHGSCMPSYHGVIAGFAPFLH